MDDETDVPGLSLTKSLDKDPASCDIDDDVSTDGIEDLGEAVSCCDVEVGGSTE